MATVWRRRSCCTRCPTGPAGPADCSASGSCGSARPWRGSRPACRGNGRDRWPASATVRWPSHTSSDRRPSPRTRTCWRCRCRTWKLRPHWSRRPRNASRRPPSSPSAATHQARAEWALVSVSSVVKVLDEMMNSVSAGSRSRAGPRPCRCRRRSRRSGTSCRGWL